MRFVAVLADVAMGSILGIFLFAVLIRIAPSLGGPMMATIVIVVSVIAVMLRRPNGSLAVWQRNR